MKPAEREKARKERDSSSVFDSSLVEGDLQNIRSEESERALYLSTVERGKLVTGMVNGWVYTVLYSSTGGNRTSWPYTLVHPLAVVTVRPYKKKFSLTRGPRSYGGQERAQRG